MRSRFVDGRLYVIPFESNNKTQLSGGKKEDIDGDLVTFDAWEHSIRVNNVLSSGARHGYRQTPGSPGPRLVCVRHSDRRTDRNCRYARDVAVRVDRRFQGTVSSLPRPMHGTTSTAAQERRNMACRRWRIERS